MALYVIGDLHLSLGVPDKSMEVFGSAWEHYIERLAESLSVLTADDTLVLAGDTSWGMRLSETAEDFRFLEQFSGRKLLVKGNHDYWWTTAAKFHAFCDTQGFHSLEYLYNNCAFYSEYALCGTRGWFYEDLQYPQNTKIMHREVQRLELSLQAAGERPILCFLHYPPITQGYRCMEILTMLDRYRVRQCYYGHLHGSSIRRRFEGRRADTDYFLISADHLGFQLKKICE